MRKELLVSQIMDYSTSKDESSLIITAKTGFKFYIRFEEANLEDIEHAEEFFDNKMSSTLIFKEENYLRGDSNWGRWNQFDIEEDGIVESSNLNEMNGLFNLEKGEDENLNIGEREALLKEFYTWVSSSWKYRIKDTSFMKSLKKKGKFHKLMKGKPRQPSKYDPLLARRDWNSLFRIFVAFSLNETQVGMEKWIVKDSLISNIFINSESEITLMLKYEDYDPELDIQALIDEQKEILLFGDHNEYEENGYTKSLYKEIKNVTENVSNPIFRVVYINTSDYETTIDGDETKVVWGLPSFFSRFKFNKRVDAKENKTFTISTNNSSKNSYIQYGPSNKEKIYVIPINAYELAQFIESVKEKEGSIDSLFNLNVRDRKNITSSNKIYKGIENSVMTDNLHFFMMNNGITSIVDSSLIQRINGEENIVLKNIKIINGQQTTNSIFTIFEKNKDDVEIMSKLKSTTILMKVFEVDINKSDEEKRRIFNKIAAASNTQNKVNDKDIISTFEFNSQLSEKLMKLGIYYKFRDGNSDYSSQFKGMPTVNIQEIIKVNFMVKTGIKDAKNKVNKIMDAILDYANTGEFKKETKFNKYAKEFMDLPESVKAETLYETAAITAFFKGQKSKLKIDSIENELAALDMLIYMAANLSANGKDWQSIDIEDFRSKCFEFRKQSGRGQNEFYKSAVHTNELWEHLKWVYKLEEANI